MTTLEVQPPALAVLAAAADRAAADLDPSGGPAHDLGPILGPALAAFTAAWTRHDASLAAAARRHAAQLRDAARLYALLDQRLVAR